MRSAMHRILAVAVLLAPLGGCVGTAYQYAQAPAPQYRQYDIAADVLFAFGSAQLVQGASAALASELGQIRAVYPYPAIEVRGYTDSIGSASSNLSLSVARAESVRAWLIEAGIPAGVITVRGYGEADPVAPNRRPNGADDPAGRQQNRRVVLVARPA